MAKRTLLRDRTVLEISGPEALGFLQGLVTNDLANLQTHGAAYAALLTPQGKVLCDFFVVKDGTGVLYLDCPKKYADDLQARLTRYKLRAKVEIRKTNLAIAAVWDAEELPEMPESAIVYADPRHAKMGSRIVGNGDALSSLFPDQPDPYHEHRIALGVPDSGDLPPDTVFALDAGFEELNGVSFKKGCFIGQEVTSRMKHRASARKRFFVVHSEVPLTDGTPVEAAGKELGIISSGGGRDALALVRLDRIGEAMEAGAAITANGNAVTLKPPPWFENR